MVFIWRGFGLIVPIVFGICAWIVSYWYDDTRLGNASFMGWSCFYASIVLLLPGLGMFRDKDEEDGTKRYHDFMFVPILFWSLGLGVLCAYLLFTRDPEPNEDANSGAQTEQTDVKEDAEEAYRMINFINSGEDTLEVVINGVKGEIDRVTIDPKSWDSRELRGDLSFEAFDRSGKSVKKIGKTSVAAPDAKDESYQTYWVQLGDYDLLMLDVTEMMPADFTTTNLKAIDWTKRVVEVYEFDALMKPALPKDAGVNPKLLEPGDVLPSNPMKDQKVYALFSVPAKQELNNEYMIERLSNLYFK